MKPLLQKEKVITLEALPHSPVITDSTKMFISEHKALNGLFQVFRFGEPVSHFLFEGTLQQCKEFIRIEENENENRTQVGNAE